MLKYVAKFQMFAFHALGPDRQVFGDGQIGQIGMRHDIVPYHDSDHGEEQYIFK